MTLALYRARLQLHTALGTPLAGDTLFGQCCWAAREQWGETELQRLLDGYTDGHPWLVVSDGLPEGYLPKPTLPQSFEPAAGPATEPIDAATRKANKAKRWIPLAAAGKPLKSMLKAARSDKEAYANRAPIESVQPHNTLNRLTGTTGTDEFAPYTQHQTFFASNQPIDLYLVLDESRLPVEKLRTLLETIGMHGHGRDASSGLGKFGVDSISPHRFDTAASTKQTSSFWTLAPCAPQGLGFDVNNSFWRVITRFGRHGNRHALAANPFKNPVLLAATGAIFTADKSADTLFIGQGLGSNGQLSISEPATVQQGYAPVVNIHMDD